MRADCEVGVVALGADEGLDELAALLDGRCPGPGGISPVVDGLAELGPRAAAGRAGAADLSAGRDRDRPAGRRMPTALVVSQPELAGRLVADVFGALLALDPADRAVLLETLDAWLACEGSAGRAAGRLYCHRNTVFNRLRRLEQLTSRSLSRPRDLMEMTLALDAYRFTRADSPAPQTPDGLTDQPVTASEDDRRNSDEDRGRSARPRCSRIGPASAMQLATSGSRSVSA